MATIQIISTYFDTAAEWIRFKPGEDGPGATTMAGLKMACWPSFVIREEPSTPMTASLEGTEEPGSGRPPVQKVPVQGQGTSVGQD